MSLNQKFEAACEEIRRFTKRPSNEEMLEIYSLYKQATRGDCDTEPPSDMTGLAKWEAWNKKKGVDKNKAKEQYVLKANALSPVYS